MNYPLRPVSFVYFPLFSHPTPTQSSLCNPLFLYKVSLFPSLSALPSVIACNFINRFAFSTRFTPPILIMFCQHTVILPSVTLFPFLLYLCPVLFNQYDQSCPAFGLITDNTVLPTPTPQSLSYHFAHGFMFRRFSAADTGLLSLSSRSTRFDLFPKHFIIQSLALSLSLLPF